MKRIALVLLAVLMAGVCWGELSGIPSNTVFRVTDGIGWQYGIISSNLRAVYGLEGGFGGVADTLATDTTVSRGTLMNIKRIKESNDAGLAELLPIFVSSRTQLDSSYMYTKWSAPIWGLNNYFSSVGGLSAWQQARPDSGRFSPYFARVARANGVYLAAKSVFPPGDYTNSSLSQSGDNFGKAVLAVDSSFTYTDSASIDSSLYGPAFTKTVSSYVSGFSVYVDTTGASVGQCSLLVFGSNQSLIHARKWAALITSVDGQVFMAPAIAGDSIYNIDSAKVKMVTATMAARFLFLHTVDRLDSL